MDCLHPFIQKVRETLEAHRMLRSCDRVLIGFSGGPDSTALARVLLALKKETGAIPGLAHLNHGLRGAAADRDQEFARTFARENRLEIVTESADITGMARESKLSLEEAGREARYEFFARTAREKGYACIALGHHLDDHTEQVLMNLIRGTGLSGLSGIPPRREGNIIRPLIRVTKAEILSFLNDIGQPFVIDATNQETTFLRNRVRHRLIPFIEEAFNPDIRAGLTRLSRIASLENEFMEETADKAFKWALMEEGDHCVTLASGELLSLHRAVASRVLRRALKRVKQDLKRITLGHIDDILALAESSVPGKHIDLPGRIRVHSLKNALCIRREDRPLRELGKSEKLRPNGV